MSAHLRHARSLLAGVLLLMPQLALAASSPFGIATPDGSGSVAWAGPFKGVLLWIAGMQASFYQALTDAIGDVSLSRHASLYLVALSFAYGVFHAIGPGHGKAVISSYLLVTGEKLRRGIVISFASGIVQGITAILVVSVGTLVFRVTAVTMTHATDALEIASYAMIVACGAWLLWTKAFRRRQAEPAPIAAASFAGPSGAGYIGRLGSAPQPFTHDFSCQAGEGIACDCGHAHMPDPALMEKPLTLRRAWAAILSVGIRPCSGAIIVLVFAISQQLYGTGLLSVFAMSIGTGFTVAVLATLAVKAKDTALLFTGRESAGKLRALRGIEIAASLGILVFGLLMLGGALAVA